MVLTSSYNHIHHVLTSVGQNLRPLSSKSTMGVYQGRRNDKKARGINARQRGTSIDSGEDINLQ